MRSRVAMVALAGSIFIACKAGQQGPMGPAGLSIGDGGVATTCQPGARFCDGTGVWACSRVGLDALLLQDCALNSNSTANNPYECSTTHCGPYDYGACCNSKKPACSWNMTSPLSGTGSSYRYAPSQIRPACFLYANVTCPGTGYLEFDWTDQDYTTCQAGYRYFWLEIDRSAFSGSFPRTISLSPAPAGLWLYHYWYTNGVQDPTKTCNNSWTGTVTWTSDAPSWSITVNATCSSPLNAVTISGTFNGDL